MGTELLSKEFIETFSAIHATGLPVAKTFALYGAGFSVGKNIVKTIRGSIRGGVAIADVIRDTIISFGVGYIIGATSGGAIISAVTNLTAQNNSEFVNAFMNRLLGMIYAAGADVNAVSAFAMTAPPVLLGALIGGIFAFLFSR